MQEPEDKEWVVQIGGAGHPAIFPVPSHQDEAADSAAPQYGSPPPEAVQGNPDGPTGILALPATPFERRFEASAITGTFDGWPAIVDKVYYDTDPEGVTGKAEAIGVTRCSVDYDTNHEPVLAAAPTASGQAQTQIAAALPLPPRHDQQKYVVAAGDVVTCISGRDGKIYFIADELPFVATVLGEGVNSGSGSGLASVEVRRQFIGGSPDALALSDLKDSASVEIDYDDVWVVGDGTNPGYAVGDRVLVLRRGQFLFCLRKVEASFFWARITDCDSVGVNKWEYDFEEVAIQEAEMGGWEWAALEGGRADVAKNTIEDMNNPAGTGMLGIGIAAEDLETDYYNYELRPAPTGAIVRMNELDDPIEGGKLYFFQYENSINGGCIQP